MIDRVLYGTPSYSAQPTTINYKFNLETNLEENIAIPFENKGGYDTSLHYVWKSK
jgi:hypothetical protein